jgi:PEGA domain
MKLSILCSASALVLSGCASIFNGQTQPITISSAPDGATVTVTNRNGDKVHAGTTPVTLTLKRGAGYFKSESYTVSFSKPGFTDKEVVITSSISGWYFGNILFGGVIGMVGVDPATGGMYVFPDTVSPKLEAEAAKTGQAATTLKIVSTESLTPEQLKNGKLLMALR